MKNIVLHQVLHLEMRHLIMVSLFLCTKIKGTLIFAMIGKRRFWQRKTEQRSIIECESIGSFYSSHCNRSSYRSNTKYGRW